MHDLLVLALRASLGTWYKTMNMLAYTVQCSTLHTRACMQTVVQCLLLSLALRLDGSLQYMCVYPTHS